MSMMEARLKRVIGEIVPQRDVGRSFPASQLDFDSWLAQLNEFIDHGEWGIAFESLVATLEIHDFKLSGPAAIALLEAALLLGYKTDRPQDAVFDRTADGKAEESVTRPKTR